MSQTILVVDDSQTIRQVVNMALKVAPYKVVGVGTGEEALHEAGPETAAILLDYHLSDLSGYEVCRRLKDGAETAEVPVVMMAGSKHGFNEGQAREAGADRIIPKPFNTDTLLDAVVAATGISKKALVKRKAGSAPTSRPDTVPKRGEKQPEAAVAAAGGANGASAGAPTGGGKPGGPPATPDQKAGPGGSAPPTPPSGEAEKTRRVSASESERVQQEVESMEAAQGEAGSVEPGDEKEDAPRLAVPDSPADVEPEPEPESELEPTALHEAQDSSVAEEIDEFEEVEDVESIDEFEPVDESDETNKADESPDIDNDATRPGDVFEAEGPPEQPDKPVGTPESHAGSRPQTRPSAPPDFAPSGSGSGASERKDETSRKSQAPSGRTEPPTPEQSSTGPAKAGETGAAAAGEGPSLEGVDLEAKIREQVNEVVKAQLPKLMRKVMGEVFKKRVLPKLMEHGEKKVEEAISDELDEKIRQHVQLEIERLLEE